jgi:hypothetical protein
MPVIRHISLFPRDFSRLVRPGVVCARVVLDTM